MCLEDILSAALSGVAEKARLSDKSLVENVAVGNVLAPGGAATVSRMAVLHAGYPVSLMICLVSLNTSQ
jgi:acetyl-CoA acyltransferase 1